MLFAHGVGTRGDLPLPMWQFAWAATAALVVSFVALGALWTTPRMAAAAKGRSLPVGRGAVVVMGMVARAIALSLFVLVIAAAWFGVNDTNTNLAPVAIYVVFWVGLAVVAGLIGDIWSPSSPFDTLSAARTGEPSTAPAWSWWIGPALMFGFLVLELVHPDGSEPRTLAIAATVYVVAMLAAAWRWGRLWLVRGEAFGHLFALLGAMSPFTRGDDGGLRLRVPLSGLSTVDAPAATTALLLIVLGGTSFDGFSESEIGRSLFEVDGTWAQAGLELIGIIASIAIVTGLYVAATRFSASATGATWSDEIRRFTPSLVPIVFGYTVAHYAQLLIDETQTFVFLLSDPFGQGWNLFGGADNRINFNLVGPDLIAWIQALGIVLGHIAAVIVAHDRAVADHGTAKAARSQHAMLFVMVAYSVLGLWLLLNA